MTKPMPSFPAFDEWQRMSEREQDALIDKIETVRGRSRRNYRIVAGLVCAILMGALGVALYVILMVRL